MKPNFALTLSFEGIALMHRAFPGWHLVGDVGLDDPDLSGALAILLQTAQQLDPSGVLCKLVLPNDQVKYININAFGDEDDGVEPLVRDALEGATPYGVDDLAHDWALKDGRLTIAAVARETLAEAEAFASDHGFNPVCFVATPENGDYEGEPFFGQTAWAQANLDKEDEVERDPVPIRVIGVAKLPEPEEEPAAPQTEIEDTPPEHEAEPAEPEIEVAEAAPEPEQDPEPEPEPEPEEDAPSFASIRAMRGEDDTPTGPRRLEGVSRDAPPPRITFASPPVLEEDDALDLSGVTDAALPMDDLAPEERPVAASVTEFEAEPAFEPEHEPEPGTFEPDPAPVLFTHEDPEPYDEAPEPIPVAAPPPPTPEPERRAAFFTRRSRRSRTPDPRGGTAIPEPQDEKQRMTIFGARDPVAVGGKPRFLGIFLTAVLLIFLIGVAAWASIFMDEGLARFFKSGDPPSVASLPTPEEAEAALSPEEELELASLTPSEPVSVLDDPATEILSRVNPQDLSPDEAKARYAATGIWQLAPEPSPSPQPTDLEEFYQTSLDPDPEFEDAVALPGSSDAYTDGMMFSPASPPAADTQFVFDARGFVLAKPDGALSPDGVVIYAGQPPVTAPAKPGTAIAQSDPDTPDTVEQAEDTAQAPLFRPRARPTDFAEQIERSELSGRTRTELAALRPKLRPESAQEAAEEARRQAEAQALAQQQAEAAAAASVVDGEALDAAVASATQATGAQAATLAFAGATPQAVKSSIKPKLKPRNMANIVKRAQRSQARQSQEGATQQTVAVRANQRVSPKIPSKASVSKRATQRNALKFKRVNLIGVYGSPSSRRALVRMSNGRYKKVKIGDRLDGGRVSAIGDSDLRYTKGGRTVILKMPRG